MTKISRAQNDARTWQPNEMKDLPWHLRGPSNNRFGGQQRSRLRGLRGTTYGAASECRTLNETEQQAAIARLRSQGQIS